MPFYLLVRANAAWTPHPRFFPDDAVYARMCFPAGFVAYWNDFGFYRLLAVPAYALSNRAVMRASLSPVPYTLIALALATVVFVYACLSAGLSRRRGVLLAGVLLSSPLLLETLNFWSGTFNYALVLLLVSAQLRAGVWARGATGEESKRLKGAPSRGFFVTGFFVTACGALLALLTYEIALPFILASSAFYVRGWLRRACVTGLACVAAVALVLALVAAGLYWPQRFKLAAGQLTSAVYGTANDSANDSANNSANDPASDSANATMNATNGTPDASTTNTTNTTTNANTTNETANADATPHASATLNTMPDASATDQASVPADAGQTPAPHASSARERLVMYVSLSFSFLRTGLRSPWLWALALALVCMIFLARRAGEEGRLPREEGRLPRGVVAAAFAFALVACVGYLALTKSMNARYVAFLLIYGAATLAWTKGRVACYALASLLLVQAAVAASLPIHMRDVERAAKGGASATHAPRAGDLVNTDGRLARASWGKRFLAPPAADMLTRPLSPQACRYVVPCEECK